MPKPSEPLLDADGALLVDLVSAAAQALEVNRDTINALNVFPVPDGDTGTNMLLTVKSVLDDLNGYASSSVAEISKKMASSALLGARGNSGLILAQFFKGLSEALDGESKLAGEQFARSIRIAATKSYGVVPNPVEGTMLTVYRECAEVGENSSDQNKSLEKVLADVAAASIDSVGRTPGMLPVLAEAEVVDSGGFGFAVMLDGALRYLRSEVPFARVINVPLPENSDFSGSANIEFVNASEELDWGYCTVFAIEAEKLNLENIRDRMELIGRSPIVDGMGGVAKVHVHMEDPGKALSAGLEYGILSNIEIANMDNQTAEWASERRDDDESTEVVSSEIAVVAVAAGDGLKNLMKSAGLGVTSIVDGGDTMNSSVADLLTAVETAPSDHVILLPNNKNIVPAAQQIPSLTDKTVRVVPTCSVQTGISALVALRLDQNIDENAEAMNEIISEVGEGRICKATKNVTIDKHEIHKGMTFGTFNDDIITVGHDPIIVLTDLIQTQSNQAEIVTVYTGEMVNAEQIKETTKILANKFDTIDIEVVYGGQPHYDYLIAVE